MQTQLHSALTQFPETAEQSVPGLLALVLLYLLVIGPVDYLFVHRLLKRPELTWFSFPGVVLLAVLLATVTAKASRDANVAANQLDIVDYDSITGHVRKTSWAAVYSPENCRYTLALEHDDRAQLGEAMSESMSWLANPDANFGGMYRNAGFEVGKPEYDFATDLTSVRNAPISVASTRSWQANLHLNVGTELIESKLHRGGVGQFSGDSYFVHHFASPIDNWMIAYAGRVYILDMREAGVLTPSTMLPGQRVVLGSTKLRNAELRSFMTGASYTSHKTGKDKATEEQIHTTTKYDPTNSNLLDISRMVSFHRAAGGVEYTTLTNTALQRLDLTDMTSLDRAVLFGQLELPATRVLVDGREQKTGKRIVIVRCLMPVTESSNTTDVLPKFKK